MKLHEDILAILKFGKANAMRGNKVAQRVGIKGLRGETSVGKAVAGLVMEGYPIGSCQEGYYIISSREELTNSILTLKRRIHAMEFRIKELQKHRKDFGRRS